MPSEPSDVVERLRALLSKATPGPWELDTEYDDDAIYSGGGGCGRGFKNYFIGATVPDNTEHGKWATLFDSVNSDHKLIEEDFDEDGNSSWDEIGRCNAELIVALVNAAPELFTLIEQQAATIRELQAEVANTRAKALEDAAAACANYMADCLEDQDVQKGWPQTLARNKVYARIVRNLKGTDNG